MKVLVFYFTGSGNTEKVLKKFEEEFVKNGHSVDYVKVENQLYKLDKKIHVNFDEYDLLGVGYPVHAFNAPQIMLQWAKSLEILPTNKRAFIITTSAEPLKLNNVSSLKLGKILKKKGFDIQNEYHYVMPYDMIFRHPQKMTFRMWDTAQKLIPIDAKTILDGRKELLSHLPCGSLFAWIMRIEHFGAKFNGIFYTVDNKKCIKCNKCVNNCPTNNIKRNKKGKLKFGANCTMCQRCTHFCPTDAIKTGLFNTWRVNTPYTFQDTDDETAYDKPMTPKEKKRAQRYISFWCKGPYITYFKEAEEKIKKNEENK